MVLQVSVLLRSPVVLSVGFTALAAGSWAAYRWSCRNEYEFSRLLSRVPVVGRMTTLATMSRFANMFHMLSLNGVSVPQCLELAKGALGNAYFRRAVSEMIASVEAGKGLAPALRGHPGVPPNMADMIAVAEESGKMNEVLASVAKLTRTQLMRSASRITILLEPLMLLVLGTAGLVVVLSFFVPYIGVLGSLANMK